MVERENSREQTVSTLENIAQNLSRAFDQEVGEHIPSLPMEQMGSYYCQPDRPQLALSENENQFSPAYKEKKKAFQ